MVRLAVISLSLLLGSGLYSGVQAEGHACGCEADCPEGFVLHSVTSCHDKKLNICKSHTDDKGCEIECSKKGEPNKKVTGTCHEVKY